MTQGFAEQASGLGKALPSEAEALWLLDGWPRKLVLSFSSGGRRLLLPALSKEAAGPDAAGRCRGKPVSTLIDGAAHHRHVCHQAAVI